MALAITFEPFPPSALDEWIKKTVVQYIDERVAAGDSLAEAESNANSSIERLFPNGSPAPGQLVGRLERSKQIVAAC